MSKYAEIHPTHSGRYWVYLKINGAITLSRNVRTLALARLAAELLVARTTWDEERQQTRAIKLARINEQLIRRA